MEARTISILLAGFVGLCPQVLRAQDIDSLFNSITTTCPPCTLSHYSTPETTAGDLGTIGPDGVYRPKDKTVSRLYHANDFKSFTDYSFRKGGKISVGFAYELVDQSYYLPRSAKRLLRQQDREFQKRLKEMTPADQDKNRELYKIARGKIEHKLRRPEKFPRTLDLGVDSERVGLHFGTKLLGIIDLGPFFGIKRNFAHGDWERTVGVQILKLGF